MANREHDHTDNSKLHLNCLFTGGFETAFVSCSSFAELRFLAVDYIGLQELESFNSVMGYKLLPCTPDAMYGYVISQQVEHMPECCPEQDWI